MQFSFNMQLHGIKLIFVVMFKWVLVNNIPRFSSAQLNTIL